LTQVEKQALVEKKKMEPQLSHLQISRPYIVAWGVVNTVTRREVQNLLALAMVQVVKERELQVKRTLGKDPFRTFSNERPFCPDLSETLQFNP